MWAGVEQEVESAAAGAAQACIKRSGAATKMLLRDRCDQGLTHAPPDASMLWCD
jgi:hypothetical protein